MSAFTEANKKAFDELSKTYNTKPWQRALSNQISQAILARKDWIFPSFLDPKDKEGSGNREVKLLDFACGTGNVSVTLEPFVTTIRGIDLSPNMVQSYNSLFSNSSASAYAVAGDLFAREGPPAEFTTSEFSNFDLVVVGLGFHHFEDPELALARLVERVKGVEGWVVVIDFLPFEHSAREGETATTTTTIKHAGFTPERLRDLFVGAGLVDFEIVALKEKAVVEGRDGGVRERTVFFAKGRKAGSVLQRLGAWIGGVQDVVGGQMDVGKNVGGGEKWNPGVGGGGGGEGRRWDMVGGSRNEGKGEEGERKAWNGF